MLYYYYFPEFNRHFDSVRIRIVLAAFTLACQLSEMFFFFSFFFGDFKLIGWK